jgi:secondary thiamine-phosphate synthase enzyme
LTENFRVQSKKRIEYIDITQKVKARIKESGVKEGLCFLFVPHTTAGITINEHADPSVAIDIQDHLKTVVPHHSQYKHTEGNADAHIKSTLTGVATLCAIENGNPVLGTWQGIFFCEYDGPRTRSVHMKILEG